MRGRRPDAPELRLLRGTHKNYRHGDPSRFVDPGTLDGTPPAGLQSAGKAMWKRLHSLMDSMGTLKATDFDSLRMLCECADELKRCRAEIAKAGRYVATARGGLTRHPATVEEREIMDRQFRLLVEFGLTPSSRGRVAGEPKPKSGIQRRERG